MMDERLQGVLDKIDAINSEDPTQVEVDGESVPAALLYSQRMTTWLEKRRPEDCPDTLKIAARAQHIRRWDIPRSDYPDGRRGYLEWRKTLYHYHAEKTGAICEEAGYDEEFVDKVKSLLEKRCLATNWDMQSLEDCACLVFLEHHFAETTEKTGRNKMIRIVQKTWGKMTEIGHQFALEIDYAPELRGLIEEALGTKSAE